MDKEKDRMENGSYFYKLNQELSGEKSITPYFIEMGMEDQAVAMGEVREGQLSALSDEGQNLS